MAARGGMATGDRGVARRAKTGGFGAVPLGFARMPRAEAQGASLITAEGPERSRRDYLLFIESFATDSSPLPPHRGGGQALQRRVKPRPAPPSAKAQPTYTEAWIDYSESQDAPSDRGLYHHTFIQNSRYVFEV